MAGELSVEFAWIRTAPPSSQVFGGYMTVNNGLAQDISLLGVHSDRFASIEFHQVNMRDGQMQMRQLERVDVPANSQRQLAPNENHLMLFNPTTAFHRGERIHLRFVLQYADGQRRPLDLWFLVLDKGPNPTTKYGN